jgi:hypothetical protein
VKLDQDSAHWRGLLLMVLNFGVYDQRVISRCTVEIYINTRFLSFQLGNDLYSTVCGIGPSQRGVCKKKNAEIQLLYFFFFQRRVSWIERGRERGGILLNPYTYE